MYRIKYSVNKLLCRSLFIIIMAVDLMVRHLRESWFYRLIERRWGRRAAMVMEMNRRARQTRELRQRVVQRVEPPPSVKQSRGIGV